MVALVDTVERAKRIAFDLAALGSFTATKLAAKGLTPGEMRLDRSGAPSWPASPRTVRLWNPRMGVGTTTNNLADVSEHVF